MMLRESTHGWKVNFCKFTNETRLAIEDASAALRHQVPRRAERHLRRRRLRARARLRRDPPRRRRQLRGEPAGGAAARRAARHRRPDARRRQAARAPRPRRLLQHARRRREGQARGRRGGSSTRSHPTSQFKDAVQSARRALAAASDRPGERPRHRARTRSTRRSPTSALTYSAVSLTFNRDKRTAELTVQAPTGPQPSTPDDDPQGRRSVLAAARVPRAGRCAAAAAAERAGDRHGRHQDRRRSARPCSPSTGRWPRISRTGWSARSSC